MNKELQKPISVGTKDNQVFINFNQPIVWISMEPLDALVIAEALIKHSRNLMARPVSMIEVPKEKM